jgi:quercetin dioxygenase-like cupin family protein/uncharacterized protein YndB with AHSA1/START domain
VAKAGDVLEIPKLGMKIVFRQTASETNGELVEYDVIGRPRGFVTQGHVHTSQEERQEVIAGEAGIEMNGGKRTLHVGESVVIPRGTSHRHFPPGAGEGQIRVELRPALGTETFLERLAALDREGQITSRGFPKPVAGAHLMRDFAAEGHATRPPLPVQRAFAATVLGLSGGRGEYLFLDEWDVRAPIEAVFNALADGTTYPDWWRPVYISVEADGPLAVGQVSRQHFKGRLPYHLHTTSRIVRLEPPHIVSAEVDGDLRGKGVWMLTERGPDRTHVQFDWRAYADKPIVRTLTPVLRPLFRWNHAWAIARAIDGLEPYARR